jgi:pimeloyl-ACP methyl ester carboxylesterase
VASPAGKSAATRQCASGAAEPEPGLTRSLLLAHGAGSGPWIFEAWANAFPGICVEAIDLHAGLAVAHASMSNYAAVLYRTAELLPRPRVLCGWSMGGLVAMLAAERAAAERLILLEPSPPAEIQGTDPAIGLAEGTFDPEQEYGPFPLGVPGRSESVLARRERKRGIAVPELPCPALVVYGDEFAAERGRSIGARYGATEAHLPGLDHWALVLDPRGREAAARWLEVAAD